VTTASLPTINAFLNAVSAALLMFGYIKIKQGNRAIHKKIMLSSVVSSALFLISYLIYHYQVGSVPYPYHDWTRPVYYIILVPHVILAGVMVPFILAALYFAFRSRFEKHRKIVRWIWPVWMFVSLSGIAIYLMLYKL